MKARSYKETDITSIPLPALGPYKYLQNYLIKNKLFKGKETFMQQERISYSLEKIV